MIFMLSLKVLFPGFWIRRYHHEHYDARNQSIEYYVIAKTLICWIIAVFLRQYWFFVLLSTYLLIDTIVYFLGLIALSDLNKTTINIKRNLLMFGFNSCEIICWYAILYLCTQSLWTWDTLVVHSLDAIYYSTVTFATVWYGDYVTRWSIWHVISMLQIFTSFLFVSLVISATISKMDLTSD